MVVWIFVDFDFKGVYVRELNDILLFYFCFYVKKTGCGRTAFVAFFERQATGNGSSTYILRMINMYFLIKVSRYFPARN